ncbi:TPA: hypothetical protein DEW47_03130 [Patescibacteria group bacterium]|nr:MAG: Peptidase, M23 family [Parcubacteria group bacterium GW2011_GWF2_40_10]KKR48046.1 MAG: Peptidase, M23 family [Parcubacteria group bacterium GW2011_GWA2_40_143]KKR60526.1 MAG: Peptidase, M23 family [Parcubacteria group bacterium GW2011_GWC2_40_31]KKR75626.1 MAG: Peptidase, M23 family [Parcubacteria group bacterium GW2011_GWB2_40_8]KKR76526.1 MAG: Peptidase, M23 family [Parcubacteria group bacterium GW2011_GWE2_40_8]KKR81144.1 MAG: Peptidase, M23 family [Parcubacteria group bacterium GW2
MKIQEYKFVPEKGAVTTTADLNLREGKPMVTNTPISKEAGVGTMLNYIGYVLDGQEIGGISKWYLTPEGDFFWSGNVSTKKSISNNKVGQILHKPLKNLICTQRFAERPSFYKDLGSPKGHNGMDFRTKKSDGTWTQDIFAVLGGEISEAIENKWNGKFVRIAHDNGYESVYLHLSEISIKKGQKVKAGSKIGISGNSGAASEAPHLHFGYRPIKFDKGNGHMGYIDPAPYFIDEIQYLS